MFVRAYSGEPYLGSVQVQNQAMPGIHVKSAPWPLASHHAGVAGLTQSACVARDRMVDSYIQGGTRLVNWSLLFFFFCYYSGGGGGASKGKKGLC